MFFLFYVKVLLFKVQKLKQSIAPLLLSMQASKSTPLFENRNSLAGVLLFYLFNIKRESSMAYNRSFTNLENQGIKPCYNPTSCK